MGDRVGGTLRPLKFLPLAFLAGVDGFAMFAPYLAATVAASHLIWAVRRRRERDAAELALGRDIDDALLSPALA